MLVAMAKFAAWCLRLEPSAAAVSFPPVPSHADPAPRPGCAPRRHRSRPAASPLTRTRVPRSPAQPRIALAERRAALAPPRRTANARPPKRARRPRHVWLEPRAPGRRGIPAAVVLLAPGRGGIARHALQLAA